MRRSLILVSLLILRHVTWILALLSDFSFRSLDHLKGY